MSPSWPCVAHPRPIDDHQELEQASKRRRVILAEKRWVEDDVALSCPKALSLNFGLDAGPTQCDILASTDDTPPCLLSLKKVPSMLPHQSNQLSPPAQTPTSTSTTVNSTPWKSKPRRLPTEILQIIFQKLDRHRAELSAVNRVNKEWSVVSQSLLYRQIHITSFRSFLSLISALGTKRHLLLHTVCLFLPFLDSLPDHYMMGVIWWHVYKILINAPNLEFISNIQDAPAYCFDAICQLPKLFCLHFNTKMMDSIRRVMFSRQANGCVKGLKSGTVATTPVFPKVFTLLNRGDDMEPLQDTDIQLLGNALPNLGIIEVAVSTPKATRAFLETAAKHWRDLSIVTMELQSLTHVPTFSSHPNAKTTINAITLPTVKTLNLVILDEDIDDAFGEELPDLPQFTIIPPEDPNELLINLLPRFPNLERFGIISRAGITGKMFLYLSRFCPRLCELAGTMNPFVKSIDPQICFGSLQNLSCLVIEMSGTVAKSLASSTAHIGSWWSRLKTLHMHLPNDQAASAIAAAFSATPYSPPHHSHILTIVSTLNRIQHLHIIPSVASHAHPLEWPPSLLDVISKTCSSLQSLSLHSLPWPSKAIPPLEYLLSTPPVSLRSVHVDLEHVQEQPEWRIATMERLMGLGREKNVKVVDLGDGMKC
ncbi:hypothetical protein HDU97_000951 [Phlyctochytrium planicorne]|nr:hypothetical protein HDU97_000951 [Phlyctochytrium planicorne]